MATSGTVDTSAEKRRNSYYYVTWSVTSQSTTNNTSTIHWKAYLHNEWEWYSNAVGFNSIVINGVTVESGTRYSNYKTSGDFLLSEGNLTITHNSDGTKSFTISISGFFIDWAASTGSATFTLDRINRGIANWGVNGSWKPCMVYWGVNGAWKQCLVYYGVNGQWKQVGGS